MSVVEVLAIAGILFVPVVFTLSVFIRRLLISNESLEERNNGQNDWILLFKERVDFATARLKEVDKRGSFEGDDEVGFFFTELKSINDTLKEVVDLVEEEIPSEVQDD